MSRPSRSESDRRRDELVRLLEQGVLPSEASRRSGVSATRLLRLVVQDDAVRAALRALDAPEAVEPGWLARRR